MHPRLRHQHHEPGGLQADRLAAGERTLLSARNQTLTRDYIWDETLVLGKEREEQILREAIVEDLVRVVLIQLSSI